MLWSFMDMIGLANRLPDLTGGANKWITAVEESTVGIRLALGDLKALLMHVSVRTITDEVLNGAGLTRAVTGHTADKVGFDGFRTKLWEQLRSQYAEKMEMSKLEGETLGDEQCPTTFLHAFQRR